MPERSSYAHGEPSWVDLGSPDLDQSKAFYAELFGWTALTEPNPEAGGYTMFLWRGKQVAGLGPAQEGQPPSWTAYVNVDDADKVADQVRAAGGTVLLEPMDVLDVGRMAVFADPTGATLSLWQPGAHTGAQLSSEPVSVCWIELLTRDVPAAKTFYTEVFGWGTKESEGYTELQVGDQAIAGMMAMPDEAGDTPNHWLVYFAVDDCDGVASRARGLGGEVLTPPDDIPSVGRFAVLADPHGATFAVIALTGAQ